jgi:hypothetical protein
MLPFVVSKTKQYLGLGSARTLPLIESDCISEMNAAKSAAETRKPQIV